MATNQCLSCSKWFEAKTARKKTCSNACRMALSRRDGQAVEHSTEDRTESLLSAVSSASNEEKARLQKAVFPLELEDIGASPLELRRQYGPTTDLGTVLKLRNLPPHAALLEFLDQ